MCEGIVVKNLRNYGGTDLRNQGDTEERSHGMTKLRKSDYDGLYKFIT